MIHRPVWIATARAPSGSTFRRTFYWAVTKNDPAYDPFPKTGPVEQYEGYKAYVAMPLRIPR